MGLRDVLYRAYARRLSRQLDHDADPAPRRRDHRRQPPLGQGVRRAGVDRSPARRRQDRRVPLLVRGDRRRGRHAVAAVHRQPLPQPRTSSARSSRSSRTRSTDLAATDRWRVHPMGALDLLPDDTARLLKEVDEQTSGIDGMSVNVAIGYGGRREIADAVRSLLQEHADAGTLDRGAGPGARRRAHRRAPLHQGPARPRPGDPHVRRAAAVRLPALAERALGVLLLRGLLAGLPQGRLPAGDPRLRRPAPPLRRADRSVPQRPPSRCRCASTGDIPRVGPDRAPPSAYRPKGRWTSSSAVREARLRAPARTASVALRTVGGGPRRDACRRGLPRR